MINALTRILRRDIYLKFPLNPKYTTGEEYDQQVRLLYWAEQNGFCFKYFPDYYTAANRIHKEQKSKNLSKEEKEMRKEIREKSENIFIYKTYKPELPNIDIKNLNK